MDSEKDISSTIIKEIGIGVLKSTPAGPFVDICKSINDALYVRSIEQRIRSLEADRSRLQHQLYSRQKLVEKISRSELTDQELEMAFLSLLSASERTYFFEGLFEQGTFEDFNNFPDRIGKIIAPDEVAETEGLVLILGSEIVEIEPTRFRQVLMERPLRANPDIVSSDSIAFSAAKGLLNKTLVAELPASFSVHCSLLRPYKGVSDSGWSSKLRFYEEHMSLVSVVGFDAAGIAGMTEIELVWLPFNGMRSLQYVLAKSTNTAMRKKMNLRGVPQKTINLQGVVLLNRRDISWAPVNGRTCLHLKPHGDDNYWVEVDFTSPTIVSKVQAHIERIF